MKLLELRQSKKMSQQNIADLLKVTQTTYQYYEKGKSEPSIATLCKLADYYNVSLDYLVDRKNQYDLPALTTNQIELMKIVVELSTINLAKVTAYSLGLLAGQN